ncbi:2-oxoglutarate dehydrogenase, E2 component, dihydrolipoamide succinyltransferase [Ornithinimicrobium pratense]|uniref:Dihydrolipoamide acetyltransferase component of pyruvate dehydrogenase complex n=1 Tax=Ornithinimicrobium pratense TaxID=2593973 RepID=A0A5J6V5D5_9MICO|nr:2-oxoglutarate dehydrogenase, E2 component, dihydrolipoamide succinyltransferase [Ornithinimicrobium pratense]QFG68223.1 2-oxoglutarate dehydrogenase, E2 component, dihydrolipoamide succinyltransferase [Ornithinimicrobium pratense]
MSERVSMPALGESVTEGTVTRWLKNIGDSVEVDEPLLEVSTDKVDTEIPSPVAGTLQEILAQEDDTVEVGADLCVIGEGEPSSGGDEGSSGEENEQEEQAPQEDAPQEDASQGSDSQEAQDDSSSQDQPADQSSGGSGGGEVSGGETVTMPALGESVTEGTVTRWLKSEGDQVEVDEPLLEVSTDKVDTEIPSPIAGVLTKIIAGEDETVEVGGELAVIGGEASGGGSEQDSGSAPADEPEQGDSAAEGDDQEPAADKEQAEESADSDLGEEQQVQQEAAQESASSSGAESSPSSAPDTSEAVGVGTPSADTGSSSHKQQSTSPDVSAYVTPLVRKLAAQHSVDLSSLQGTGVGGRIRKQDVLDAARAQEEAAKAPAQETPQAPAPADSPQAPAAGAPSAPAGTQAKRGTTEKMSRLRKVIAARMVESLQTGAQLTTVVEVDVTKVSRLRKRVKDEFARREGTKLSFLPFFAVAAVEALKEHPIVNSSVEDDTVIYHGAEHLGVAVDTPRGLLVPVIKDAGDLNIAGLARKIADLAERTRDNKINPDELSGGTFTLTNTGSRGALFDTPIINQPNVAILGTGTVVKRPVVVIDEDGMETIAVRDMVYLALTYDHRVVDGADAARFLTTVKERLEDGSFEV